MSIQSLSIVIPTKKCVNHCPFCVSRMHDNDYFNLLDEGDDDFHREFLDRLEFSRDKGVDTIVLTGTGEALQNKEFIQMFADINNELERPFINIELQTTGVYLDDKTIQWLKYDIGVKTISFSISDLFDNDNNLKIIGVNEQLNFDLEEIINKVRNFHLNIRLSINMLSNLENHPIDEIFNRAKELGANQITFRKMWLSGTNTGIDKWIKNNAITDVMEHDTIAYDKDIETYFKWRTGGIKTPEYDDYFKPTFFQKLDQYIKNNGRLLGRLPFGALQYSLNEMSTVVDDDCMSDEIKMNTKYYILREDGKLYFKWDDKGSLVF